MTDIITRSEAEALIAATKGKVFSVVFTKRTDGSTRKMVARLGVKAALQGGDPAYDAKAKGLVVVYDLTKRAYRSIPMEALTALNCGGKRYEVR